MPSALFNLFEAVADELSSETSVVLTPEDLRVSDEEEPLFGNLRRETKAATTEEAVYSAVRRLAEHFKGKGSRLPFDYDAETGRFSARDLEFLTFVKQMREIRSLSQRSRDFELSALERLGRRAVGALHRVGFPRDNRRSQPAFNKYLKSLGFARRVALGKEKDGGFDILWLLPIGTIPTDQ